MHKTHVVQEVVGVQEPERTGDIRIATFRRGAGIFFRDFQQFMATLKIHEVCYMCQSESDGNITLTIAYRE